MKLNPGWVSGFVDGEGTFYVGVYKNGKTGTGYQVLPEFRIVQHVKSIKVLYALKSFFGCGVVRKNHGNRFELRIRNLKHLEKIIIPFFEKNPLMTAKKFDFLKFRKIMLMIKDRKHLEKSGIIKIIKIASKMNRKKKRRTLELMEEIKQDKDIVHAPM